MIECDITWFLLPSFLMLLTYSNPVEQTERPLPTRSTFHSKKKKTEKKRKEKKREWKILEPKCQEGNGEDGSKR